MDERWSCLAVRAHIAGALDFTRFQRYDVTWYAGETLIFRELERQSWLQVYDLRYRKYVAGISVANAPELAEFYISESTELAHVMAKDILPWFEWDEHLPEKMQTLADTWKNEQAIKDLPEVKKSRDDIRAALQDEIGKIASKQAATASLNVARKRKQQKQKDRMGTRSTLRRE